MTKKENKKVQHVYIEHTISVIGGSIKLGDDTKFFWCFCDIMYCTNI